MLNPEDFEKEVEKCKNSPWYFATTYLTVLNENGELVPFTTHLSEIEFNEQIKKLETGLYIIPKTRRLLK